MKGQPLLFIAGRGNVGKALARHFGRRKRLFGVLSAGWESDPPREGYLFLAVPDTTVERVLREVYPKIPRGLRIVHFAGGLAIRRERVHLIHPFASVGPATDFSQTLCLWIGKDDPVFRRFLTAHRFRFVRHAAMPGPGYHTAAVLAGNFTQYLYAAARELLRSEGFAGAEAGALIEQLVATSLDGVRSRGIAGITGPAARGDHAVVKTETAFLAGLSPRLAKTYKELSGLIARAVRDGAILG